MIKYIWVFLLLLLPSGSFAGPKRSADALKDPAMIYDNDVDLDNRLNNHTHKKKVGSFTTSGSTGNQSVTGIGFKPEVVQFFGLTNAGSDHYTMTGAMDSSGSQWVVYGISNGTSGAVGSSTSACIHITGLNNASFVSMDANGFTINWSLSNAQTIGYIAFE